MIAVLKNRTYAKLFGAQVIALIGTGLLTVALSLLAFDIGGGDAGVILGIAMSIKMIAYVGGTPIITALAAHLPPKPVLIGADLVRAGVALALLFVTEAWHIYVLIFVLQSASATFTPTFQAVIAAVLPDEGEYTRALSLSRLAYDLEALLSPMLAAALLTLVTYNNLFFGTVIGFVGSAIHVAITRFPTITTPAPTPFIDRVTRGGHAYWAKPELRGLMGLNLVVASAIAMVIVNTVVLVQGDLGRSETDVALILGAYGAGSMIVALVIPRLLGTLPDRSIMMTGGAALTVLLLVMAGIIAWMGGMLQWVTLLVLWLLLGAATSAILTPSNRLLLRGSTEDNRAAVFAAQFSLSHACYLLTYPLAGFAGA